MENNQQAFLVASLDVAENRYEGEILIIGHDGNWHSLGDGSIRATSKIVIRTDLAPSVSDLLPGRLCFAHESASNPRPWLRRNKGRAHQ